MSVQNSPLILIIDDDRAIVSGIRLFLKKKGFRTEACNRPADVMDTLNEVKPDLILLDMNFSIETSGKEGLKLLRQIRSECPDIPVILMTGWATVQLAVEGMKQGARDFIAKPWDNDHLYNSIRFVMDQSIPDNISPDENENDPSVIGQSKVFQDILQLVHHIASTDASVLITGESGTGKEVIAEMIHALSKRRDRDFIKVNLGGISTSLFESEMFGHKKGAFTDAHSDRTGRFARAHLGTIFLDEIGDLAMASQVKLLRVLQEKTYEVLGSSEMKKTDVRIISATNKELEEMVYQGTFREDLFYRINLITIRMPSLSERTEDIPLLVDHFIDQICNIYQTGRPEISNATYDWLSQQHYPGNIRQLKNVVERALLINMNKKELTSSDFQQVADMNKKSGTPFILPAVGQMSLEDIEKQMIHKALEFHQHSISKTARALSLTRSALYRRLAKYHIPYESKI